MNAKSESQPVPPGVEPEPEITLTTEHGKMPLLLLFLWIANIAFFFGYFIINGLPDLKEWLNK